MENIVQNKLDDFVLHLKTNAPKNAVAFRLFVSDGEMVVEYEYWNKKEYRSAKNLRGEWIS